MEEAMDFKTEDRLSKYIRYIDDKIDIHRSSGLESCSLNLDGFLSDVEAHMFDLIIAHYKKYGYTIYLEDGWMGRVLTVALK